MGTRRHIGIRKGIHLTVAIFMLTLVIVVVISLRPPVMMIFMSI